MYPAVARAPDGAFVVVWETTNQDGQSYGIFAQRFDSAGARIGAEFQVNSYTSGAQRLPAVAVSPGGAFVVVWRSGANQDGSDYGVFGRRFSSAGAAQAAEFQVNQQTALSQGSPEVAIDDQGDFVVVWQSLESGYGSSTNIFARHYDSAGTPLGGEFRVNTYTFYAQRYPNVAADADGDFVVVWDSRSQDGGIGGYGVFARRYTSAGAASPDFQVNLYTSSDQFFATVAAADDGAFVIAWQSYQDGSESGIFARRFDAGGLAVGGEFQVNAHTTFAQRRPELAAASAGDFLVSWIDGARDGGSDGVFARRFDSAGSPAAADFQVNAYTIDLQRNPEVALGDAGGFVAVWQSSAQDGFGVFGKLMPPLARLDIDGDGAVGPLTDGLLVLRDHFGFTGATLVNGTVGASCTRCNSAAITTHLDGLGAQLDIDGNGSLEALTDGLLVLRYAFGFTGTALTNGAIGDSCARCDSAAIEPYLGCLASPSGGPC